MDHSKPAFPIVAPVGGPEVHTNDGISTRAYMAAAALQCLHGRAADIFTASLMPPTYASPGEEAQYCQKRIETLAKTAVAIGDALIAELEK